MQMTQLIRKLGRNDVKLIGRDSFLIFMAVFVVILAVVLRYLLPWADATLAANGIMPGTLAPYRFTQLYPMLVTFMGLYTGAIIVGTIFGFMLLDEKDDNTLKAMLVTPVSLQQYLQYRVALPAVLAFFAMLVMLLVMNQALLPLWQMALIAAGGSLIAPIFTLFYAVFAENKVQGFAYSKFGGISGWAILIGWFVPEPWQWLIGLFPPFWISKAYWLALAGQSWWWLALLLGIGLQLLLISWLIRRFGKVAHHA